jgi:polysaccharide export outer membrane protein
MLGKILPFMIAGILGVSSAALSWAGEGDAASPAAALSVSGRTEHDAASLSAMAPNEEGYLIGPGDILDIAVWKDEALTRSCVVRPDGFISFPLVGDIRAAGRTASQLKSEMEGKLARYAPGVTLSLEIKQINSMIIYVIGRVNSPGRFILNVDVNVLQALASAGGLNPFAKRNYIKILRHGADETTIYPFEYDEVIQGKRLEQNIYLRRGDVVVVP